MTPTRTNFAGFERLAPGDPLSADGFAFQSENPLIADALAKIGAVTHRHDAHAAMANPTTAPVVAVPATGGSIPASTSIHVAYTLLDGEGGESLRVTPIVVTTAAGYATPASAPTAAADYTAGTMLAGTPLYAVTVTDGAGGETALGPVRSVTVDPGHANARVLVSGLTAITNASSGSSTSAMWRLWRSVDGGSTWNLMGTGLYSTDTFTDTGGGGDCTVNPPTTGTTVGTNKLTVTVPATSQPAAATFFSIYADTTGQFLSPSLLGTYPVSDFGVSKTYTALTLLAGAPPAVSRCYPGANQIDPDTDILDWAWKRPVATYADLPAGTRGDVRMTTDTGHLWGVIAATAAGPSGWIDLTGGGGGGGSDPYGPALGVHKVQVNTATAIPSSGTGTIAIPWPAGVAPIGANRLAVGMIVTHSDPSTLAATLAQPGTSTTVDLFVAGSFEAGDTNLGDPSHVGDPEAYLYFSDKFGAFSGDSTGLTNEYPNLPLEDPGAGTIPSSRLGFGGSFTANIQAPLNPLGAISGAGDLTLSLTDSGAHAGTIESVVLYIISTEFDVLLRTSTQLNRAFPLTATGSLTDLRLMNAAAEVDAGSDITLTIMANTFPPGTTITFFQVNAGKGVFAAGTGVTLHSKGGLTKTNGQWSKVTLHHRYSELWILEGDMS